MSRENPFSIPLYLIFPLQPHCAAEPQQSFLLKSILHHIAYIHHLLHFFPNKST